MVDESVAVGRAMSGYDQDALHDTRNGTVARHDEDQTLRPTCILGMHRSGTSFISRLVNLLGIDLGPDAALFKPSPDNPKGYWEHSGIVRINDQILERFGGRWDDVEAATGASMHDPRLDDLREEARRLIAADFSPYRLWGWKDPRTCVTLPFWREVVGPMQYVLVVRNPCAVIASLSRRNGMDHEQAERLWIQHVSASLAHTTGERRLIVFYDDILRDTPRELQRLARFLGVPDRTAEPSVLTATADFVEPDLCHHRMSIEDAAVDRRLSFVTKGLYLVLRGHATGSLERVWPDAPHSRSVHRALDALGVSAPDSFRRLASVEKLALENQVCESTIATLSGERDRLRKETVTLHTEMARLTTARYEQQSARAAAERARECEAQRRAIAEQMRDQEAQARGVAEREHAAEAAARAEAERERETAQDARRAAEQARDVLSERLVAIETSAAWRLICGFRRALVCVAPGGTRRRRAWTTAVRWMRGTAADLEANGGVSMPR